MHEFSHSLIFSLSRCRSRHRRGSAAAAAAIAHFFFFCAARFICLPTTLQFRLNAAPIYKFDVFASFLLSTVFRFIFYAQ